MEISSATFVKSSKTLKELPPPVRPEYAFVGRSNVGKSSLINMLCRRNGLAKTSGTPGKTQLINHFLINDTWFLVDLPGYGYARTSQTMRQAFSEMITQYVVRRENLMNVFLLIDSRIPPQESDLSIMQWMGEKGIPFIILFTKTDKLKPKGLEANISHYQEVLLQAWEELPPMILTSAQEGVGRDDVLGLIYEVNKGFVAPK
ncbi:MAG: YihA family ribosome biogenesis GTP-binding protein [Bacteroidetes bacterium]|nr:MAG: YihA family ribosome biogenesis GTP-binding protein [Bacteroidota bacterium]